MIPIMQTISACQQSHADANGNGKVTVADALCIFKAVLNGMSPSGHYRVIKTGKYGVMKVYRFLKGT